MFSRLSLQNDSNGGKRKKVFSFVKRGAATPPPAATPSAPSTSPKRGSKPLPPPKDIASWAEYNAAYAAGDLDFDHPPAPPTKLEGSGMETSSGQHWPPTPLNESRRQRAVDALRMNSLKLKPTPKAPRKEKKRNDWDATSSSDGSSCSSASNRSSSPDSSNSSLHTSPAIPPKPAPKELPTYPVLQDLALRASKHFGTGVSTVSIMDEDQQVFLADVGLNVPQLDRNSTVCGHTILKASTGQTDPLVILDLARDWRFAKNNFGEYSQGFYAALPIHAPAPFGDTTAQSYPCGIFCILDSKPRTSFSEAERAELAAMAEEAGAEIARFREVEERESELRLAAKHEDWKNKSKVVKRIARKSGLQTVNEQVTPPSSPEVLQDPLRRPSLARTLTSESTTSVIVTTEQTPTSCQRRGSGDAGIHATMAQRVPPEIKAVLDLSTKLIAESLELEFCYVLAIDLPTTATSPPERAAPTNPKQMRLLSHHNFPMPAPLFSATMHLETCCSERSALLYSNPDYDGCEGDYRTGLLVKILVSDGVGYVLGGFSESTTRVLDRQDFLFFRTFAQDLAKHLSKL